MDKDHRGEVFMKTHADAVETSMNNNLLFNVGNYFFTRKTL